jgi:hypothetical protein
MNATITATLRVVPQSFPDPATCRIEADLAEGLHKCQSIWASRCPHLLTFDKQYICRCPRMAPRQPAPLLAGA